MANSASVNATIEEKIKRSVGRIERIDEACKKPTIKPAKKEALQAEKQRRIEELQSMKASIDAALGNG